MCALGVLGVAGFARPGPSPKPLYEISLAEWSLHRAIFEGRLDPLDFPRVTRERFGLRACEHVNQFFKDRVQDAAYFRQMRARADDAGVRSLLIMIDGEGRLGDPDERARRRAVRRHARWLEAAQILGCHSIRVNAESEGTHQEQADRCASGLEALCEVADKAGLDVLIENHGGLSSDGAWLSGLVRRVGHPRLGTLPDFGNFCLDWSRSEEPEAWYDRYVGVRQLMPYARAVSAKSHDFDERGNEIHTDYERMMRLVVGAGYRGFVGIEYEGKDLSEDEGILATKRLLERVREKLAREIRDG